MPDIHIPMVADLHCHPTIPALNTKADMWNYDPPTDKQRFNMVNTSNIFGDFTQSDYTSLSNTKARLVFHGLYPVEQGILMPDFTISSQEDWKMKVAKKVLQFIGLLEGRHRLSRFLSKAVYQMKSDRYDEMTSHNHSYFSDLQKEYALYVNQYNKHPERSRLTVIENYNQLKTLLNIGDNYEVSAIANEKAINTGVIFTVEGGHALGCGQLNSLLAASIDAEWSLLNDVTDPLTIQLQQQLFANIRTLKQWGPAGKPGAHTPFFITFCHHFWNQLCGQAMSLAGIMHEIANQQRGLGKGFTELGKTVLKELLSKENGKRILIDIKHMGTKGRSWYYSYLEELRETTGEVIPIVASHMGVTGRPLTVPNEIDPFTMDDIYKNDKTNYFNCWDINLSGEDILQIHKSGGIIGINFDQRILSGANTVDILTRMSNGLNETRTIVNDDGEETILQPVLHNILAYRAIWAQPILEAFLFIVKTIYDSNEINKEYAWQMVCIGSDFDGFINAIDGYCHSEDLQMLAYVLVEHFKNRALVDPLLQGKTEAELTEIVNGFMYKNTLRFLEKHFN